MPDPLHIRIFLSSPGDVADERGFARDVIERMGKDPWLHGRVTLEIVAWNDPPLRCPCWQP